MTKPITDELAELDRLQFAIIAADKKCKAGESGVGPIGDSWMDFAGQLVSDYPALRERLRFAEDWLYKLERAEATCNKMSPGVPRLLHAGFGAYRAAIKVDK